MNDNKAVPFLFADAPSHHAGEVFLINVSAGLASEFELFQQLSKAGKFPDYFGENWDALDELLNDFWWIQESQVVINHSDLPMKGLVGEQKIYVDILKGVVERSRERSDKQIVVLFPAKEKDNVARLLGS